MKLRVLHIPQVPMHPFCVRVDTVEEGAKVMHILCQYDLFQYENNIKPDYCNACYLQQWDEEENDYLDWYYEDEEGNYFDDVDSYLQFKAISLSDIC